MIKINLFFNVTTEWVSEVAQLCLTLCDPTDCSRLLRPWDFPSKNSGMDCHFLLQEIFPTQGLNPGLPHCRQTFYPLSHLLLLSRFSRVRLCDHRDGSPPGSPVPGILQARTLEWVAISFSKACMHAKSLQSCPTLCHPMDSSPPGSPVHRNLQARILEWVAISFSTNTSY